MGVGIDKPWQQHPSFKIDQLRAFFAVPFLIKPISHFHDKIIFNYNIVRIKLLFSCINRSVVKYFSNYRTFFLLRQQLRHFH